MHPTLLRGSFRDARRPAVLSHVGGADRGGNGEGSGGGGGGGPHREWPPWLAITLAVLLAVALTLLGMATQIMANLAGAQLPGA